MALILDLQSEQWWQVVTLPELEDVRLRIRDLLQFINFSKSIDHAFTDFEDRLIADEAAEYEIVQADPQLQDYRVRVERYIREHQDHITIRRLKNNEPITTTDLQALEELMFSHDAVIPRAEYEHIYGEKPLGLLVRSVVGLNRNAAKQAFAEFLQQAPLHPDQISFLNEVIEYLVKNGMMEPKEMFDTPFTHYHEQGVVGVMGAELAQNVIQLVTEINSNADAA